MLDLYILLIFIIVAAAIAVETKDLLSSVIALGATGLGLSLTFLVLKAPDVAITQLIVEILSLIILIRATMKEDLPFSTSGRWLVNTVITVCFIFVFIFTAVKCFKELPQFGYPTIKTSSAYLKEGLKDTGATNLVSAVILDFRAYDTLGEAAVLFTAVIGVLTILRRKGRKNEETGLDNE
jgi:multisubunit Na+/H+ antiporter MnhB subunit